MDYDCRSFPDHEVNVAPFFSEYSTHGVMIVRRNWLWLIFWRVIGKYKILFRSQSSNLFFKHKRVFYHKFVDLVFWPQQDLNYQIYLNELGNST